jgi:hypothetical protein
MAAWVERMAEHGQGILLVPARVETQAFSIVWRRADLILFVAGRMTFCRSDGEPYGRAGFPSALAAFGAEAVTRLLESGIAGHFVEQDRVFGA